MCCKRAWRSEGFHPDGFSRIYKVREAFSYCLASMLALCGISFVLAAVAEWIFEMVLHIQPHIVELWLGITAFLLGMWGMEHVFTAPNSGIKPLQESFTEDEPQRRGRHGKNFKGSDRESKRPSGVVFSSTMTPTPSSASSEKAEREKVSQAERLEGVSENTSKSTSAAGAAVSAAATPSAQSKSGQKNHTICEVWAGNFEEEFAKMFEVAKSSKYIAIDTEFPGFVLEGQSEVDDPIEVRNYASLKENVNSLKLIQLGLAFADNSGEFGLEGGNCVCWQFNFKFNLYSDLCSQDSVQMLTQANIDWERHRREGISIVQFGDKLNASGMVKMFKNIGIHWISFQGGYDFAFMLKLLTLWRMPESLEGFLSDLDEYFPRRCDMKYQLQLPSGLSSLAKHYNVPRYGQAHQAGSDALLTCSCFFMLDQHIRERAFDESGKHGTRGALFGLVPDTVVRFGRGYNGSRVINKGRREQHDASSKNNREYSTGSSYPDKGNMWTNRQVVNTLLRLAHDPEGVVANAANKALSLVGESSGDSDVSEHLKEQAMAQRIEEAQKQAIHRKMATHSWNNVKGAVPQKIPRSFVPNAMQMQYGLPMLDPHHHHHYMMQAPFIYDSRLHEAWGMHKHYMPRQHYWGRR